MISGWIHSPRETLRRDDHLEIVPCEAEAAYAGSLYVARWQINITACHPSVLTIRGGILD